MAGKAAGHVTPKQNVNGRAPSLKGKMAQVLIFADGIPGRLLFLKYPYTDSVANIRIDLFAKNSHH